jgi:WXG100 family type VII secretion target
MKESHMPSDQIQIDYEGLKDLERLVGMERERLTSLIVDLLRQRAELESGFNGAVAAPFFTEFDENFLARLQSLQEALEVCETTMASIRKNFLDAEEQAANIFPSSQ